ncbi:MAG: sensor histidine kinase [Pseudomonadota bacterium]
MAFIVLAVLACCGLALALWAQPGSGQADRQADRVLALGGTAGPVPLAGHLSVFRDESGTATMEALDADPSVFTPLPGDFNAGYSATGAWWLRVQVKPTPEGAGTWYLAINAPYTDTVDIYAPDSDDPDSGNAPVVHKRMGGLLPLSARDLQTNTLMARLVLEAGREEDIYLRISGARSLSAKPVLWRLPAFVRHLTLDVLLVSLALGASAITCIGALVFGQWLRSAAFVWYGAYVGTTALNFLANSGFLPLILDGVAPATLLRMQGMIGCASIMTGSFMMRAIFCPPGRLRLLGHAIAAYGATAGIGIVASAFGYYPVMAPGLMLGVLIFAGLLPVLAALRVWRREPAAWWYFVGFTSYAIATFWFALVVLGIAPPGAAQEWGHQTVGILHMAAVFGGLAAALRAGMRERRTLQSRLLAASQSNAQDLERAVTERTAALEAEVRARKEAEAALRVAMREQRNFLVMVSHEFRTPLATVRAAIAIIERGSDVMNDRLRKEAGKIVRAVARLSALIDTFLTEDLVDRASMRLEWGPLDLALLTRVLCRDRAAESARAIHVGGIPEARMMGDQVLLSSVVENLVGNALKHSEDDIFVTLGEDADHVWLRVSDQGRGIDPAEHDAIFERYYRSPTASSRPGAGIGLHIVRRVVEMHGGEVSVDSAPGKGSTFMVLLPRHRNLESSAPTRAQTLKA